MACVCFEDEWLGELSRSKRRSCRQCCLQFIERMLMLLVPQLGNVSSFLFLVVIACGD